MITEDYVSFETAKLLKEKGFDDSLVPVNYGFNTYAPTGILIMNNPTNSILAPTLQMAMRWLRDVHKLEIYPYHQNSPTCDKWWFEIVNFPSQVSEYESNTIYITYEEAAEAGIKYCLNNLI
jgi:hypothetical protein